MKRIVRVGVFREGMAGENFHIISWNLPWSSVRKQRNFSVKDVSTLIRWYRQSFLPFAIEAYFCKNKEKELIQWQRKRN